MDSIITKKTMIKHLITSLVSSLIFPLILIFFIDPTGKFFNLSCIISNAIIYIIIYTAFGSFRKETFPRFAIGIAYVIVLIYFFTVGFNIFTFFMPHCAFGVLCINGKLMGASFNFSYDYAWFVVMYLILKTANIVRHFLEPIDEEDLEEIPETYYFNKK